MKSNLHKLFLYYWIFYRENSGKIGDTLENISDEDRDFNVIANEISYYIFFFMSLFFVMLLFIPYLLVFNTILYYYLKNSFKRLLDSYKNYSEIKKAAYDYIIENNVSELKIKIFCNLNIIIFILSIIRIILFKKYGIMKY